MPNINIGTEKCCFFVSMSLLLIKKLEQYPLLYYAVEEALRCAENQYYTAGIITFSQLLNQLNKVTPTERHEVAHKILERRPSEKVFRDIQEEFKKAASEITIKESQKYQNATSYKVKVLNKWSKLMVKLHGKNFK